MADSNLPDKILLVDDDPTVGEAIKTALAKQNIIVHTAKDLETALYLYNQQRFDVVCVELDFEPLPGLVLVQKWRNSEFAEKRITGVVLMAGNRNDQSAKDIALMKELKDIEIITKPFTAIQLLPFLARARAAKIRSLRYQELKDRVMKVGSDPDKLDKALAMIQKGGSAGTDSLHMMRELYEKHDKNEEALNLVDKMLADDENNVSLINARGRILLKMGRNDDALACMEKADKLAPDNIERLNSLASMYLTANKPDEAVIRMKKMIDFHPEDGDLRFDMFSKLYEFGFDEHAQNLCKETTGPLEVVRYYNNKGVALNKAGKTEEALLEYERSLQFYPKFKENYRILYNIALAHIGMKKRSSYELAEEYLVKCLGVNKGFEKAQRTLEQVRKTLSGKTKAS